MHLNIMPISTGGSKMRKLVLSLCAVCAVCISFTVSAYSTVLWHDDFEWTNSTGAWDSIYTSGGYANVVMEASDSQAKFGTKSLRFLDASAVAASKLLVKDFSPAPSDVYIRFFIYHPSTYTSTGYQFYAKLTDSGTGDTTVANVYYMMGFSGSSYRPSHQGNGNWTTASWQTTPYPTPGTWQCVEYYAPAPNSTTCQFWMWLNGVSGGTSADLIDDFSLGNGTWAKIEFGFNGNASGSHTDTVEFYLDDIVIADAGPIGVNALSVDTSSPGAPGAVYDGTGTGTDIDTSGNTSSLSANWDVAVDTESGIASYQYAIGTTAGGTNTAGWATTTQRAVSVSGTYTVGNTYYFTVKATNGQGLVGPVANSDGVTITADTSGPTAPSYVYDGTGADIDTSTTTTSLRANWTAAADAESGIAYYQYAVGTSSGGTNTVAWASNGLASTKTITGTYTVGSTYYFSVRAVNGAGLTGTYTVSDGLTIAANVDTSSPTAPSSVTDGTASTMTLTASWTAATDNVGVTKYWFAIGTTPGALDTLGWADNGAASTTTWVFLVPLPEGVTYYFTVKAQDAAGNKGPVQNSAGQVTPRGIVTLPPYIPPVVITPTTTKPFPNPCDFSGTTEMKFTVSGSAGGNVKIYSVDGRLVRTLQATGSSVNWDGKDSSGQAVKSGVYMYVSAGTSKAKGKVLVVR